MSIQFKKYIFKTRTKKKKKKIFWYKTKANDDSKQKAGKYKYFVKKIQVLLDKKWWSHNKNTNAEMYFILNSDKTYKSYANHEM